MLSKFRGCLLSGAVGDALGAPVEFMALAEIRAKHGPDGVRDMVEGAFPRWSITDDTQMTLFTAEGLLRASVRAAERGIAGGNGMLHAAYLRWLATQEKVPASHAQGGYSYLSSIPALHQKRAPGTTCLTALRTPKSPGEPAKNDSKGCGGVMRVAPVGLFYAREESRGGIDLSFEVAVTAAGLTHGHVTGQLASGVFAAVVQRVVEGKRLHTALEEATTELAKHRGHEETMRAVQAARELADRGRPTAEAVQSLGKGWIAEEALAISLYCALVAESFTHGVLLAVNHSGDSDSTGSMAGQLLGAAMGEEAIPREWAGRVELGWLVREIATDLYEHHEWYFPEQELPAMWTKYPGF